MSAPKKKLEFPDIYQPLFKPSRYKILHGGRGSAKSWSIARALLVRACQQPTRILCAREFQNSIKDSVHKLLSDQILDMGLSASFDIQQTCIKGPNGSEFAFEGLRHNITKIKSYEGVDVCWVEEAQTVSKASWETLIPTVRKADSEIWVSFNPELEEDETYQRFVVSPPPGAVVIKANHDDNPWLPQVLLDEMAYLKSKDPDAYLNVWEGHCRKALEGAVYANELRKAQEDNRICNVPVDMTVPVDTFWDLGWADCTSIWMVQTVGMEIRIIDFYQAQFQPISHYVSVLQQRGYVYGTDYLPHDAKAHQLGTGKSIQEVLTSLHRCVSIVPRLSIDDGINAARTIFSRCYIDQTRCSDGLGALRRYKYDKSPTGGSYSKAPLHDEHSHAADAWRYFAVGYTAPQAQDKPVHEIMGSMMSYEGGWAGG